MSKKLFDIISRVMNVQISQINDDSGSESMPEWDSFSMYVLLNEIEKEFNIKFSLEETLEIKNVGDFRKQLEKHGVNLNE
jgi:acyl carrier protein